MDQVLSHSVAVEIASKTFETQFSELLDRSFGVRTTHYLDDFPIWRQSSDHGVFRLGMTLSEGKLAACAAGRKAVLHTRGGRLVVGIVGAVATDEKSRGFGLATRVVQAVVDRLAREGASVVLLWGSEYSLYRKLGFELGGVQARVSLAKLDITETGNCGVHEGWHPGIFDLIQSRTTGLVVEDKDLQWILAHRHVRWLWFGAGDVPIACAAIGRGMDLQGIVHQWGGVSSGVREILAYLKRENSNYEILGCPFTLGDEGLAYDQGNLEYLCLARILDPKQMIQAYYPASYVHQERTQDRWNLMVDGENFLNLSDQELVKLLLGPESVRDMIGQKLPLPLWVWGLDAA